MSDHDHVYMLDGGAEGEVHLTDCLNPELYVRSGGDGVIVAMSPDEALEIGEDLIALAIKRGATARRKVAT